MKVSEHLRTPSASPLLFTELLKRTTIHTITLTQPYATLMAIGAKQNETRSWGTEVRGPLAIHAARHWTREEQNRCWDDPIYDLLERAGYQSDLTRERNVWGLPLGCVVAVGWLEDVVQLPPHPNPAHDYPSEPERSLGYYAPLRFIWAFSSIYQLRTPIPARGKLYVWDWQPPAAFWNEIQEQCSRRLRGLR